MTNNETSLLIALKTTPPYSIGGSIAIPLIEKYQFNPLEKNSPTITLRPLNIVISTMIERKINPGEVPNASSSPYS